MVTLNREKYLPYAIDSVLAQTFSDWELLLSDGGSRDGTLAVMNAYAARDPRIRVLQHPGTNAAEARNACLWETVGEYVAILDSDDLALPERLRVQVAFMNENPSVAGVGAGFDFIDADGQLIQLDKYKKRETKPDVLRALVREGWGCFLHPSMMFRKPVLEEVRGYRTVFRVADDDDLYLRLLDKHDLANIPDLLARYRWHGENGCAPSFFSQMSRVVAVGSAHLRMNNLPDLVDTRKTYFDYGFLLDILAALGEAGIPVWLFWIGLLQHYRVGEPGMLVDAWRAVLTMPRNPSCTDEIQRHWHNCRNGFPEERAVIENEFRVQLAEISV